LINTNATYVDNSIPDMLRRFHATHTYHLSSIHRISSHCFHASHYHSFSRVLQDTPLLRSSLRVQSCLLNTITPVSTISKHSKNWLLSLLLMPTITQSQLYFLSSSCKYRRHSWFVRHDITVPRVAHCCCWWYYTNANLRMRQQDRQAIELRWECRSCVSVAKRHA